MGFEMTHKKEATLKEKPLGKYEELEPTQETHAVERSNYAAGKRTVSRVVLQDCSMRTGRKKRTQST